MKRISDGSQLNMDKDHDSIYVFRSCGDHYTLIQIKPSVYVWASIGCTRMYWGNERFSSVYNAVQAQLNSDYSEYLFQYENIEEFITGTKLTPPIEECIETPKDIIDTFSQFDEKSIYVYERKETSDRDGVIQRLYRSGKCSYDWSGPLDHYDFRIDNNFLSGLAAINQIRITAQRGEYEYKLYKFESLTSYLAFITNYKFSIMKYITPEQGLYNMDSCKVLTKGEWKPARLIAVNKFLHNPYVTISNGEIESHRNCMLLTRSDDEKEVESLSGDEIKKLRYMIEKIEKWNIC